MVAESNKNKTKKYTVIHICMVITKVVSILGNFWNYTLFIVS